MIELRIKKLHEPAVLPKHATSGAACFDLHAIETIHVPAHGSEKARTGLAVEIPAGHAMFVYSRSGHGFRSGIRLVNAVGVIDSDFRGEVAIGLRNDSPLAFSIGKGDRIAQAVVMPIPDISIVEVAELSDTQRGEGGFGSTGK